MLLNPIGIKQGNWLFTLDSVARGNYIVIYFSRDTTVQ